MCKHEHTLFKQRMELINLKEEIRADLKIIGLNRDVLKMIRCNCDGGEVEVLKYYK